MKSAQTKESSPDIRVQITPTPLRCFRIIQMQSAQKPDPDQLVKFGKEGLESFRGDEVIACGEAVTCVDADSNAGMVLLRNQSKEIFKFGEEAADCVAVAAHCF
jgi:hypothetical protein